MSELTHGYLILWFIIQLHHNLFLFLELFSLASVFFEQTPIFFKFLFYSVTSQGVSNFSCIFPVRALELTSSPRSPGSFYGRMVFRNQELTLTLRILIAASVPWFQVFYRQSQVILVWTLMHTNITIYWFQPNTSGLISACSILAFITSFSLLWDTGRYYVYYIYVFVQFWHTHNLKITTPSLMRNIYLID